MPSDLQITNIRDQANANSAITIASDGQITVNQNNPTIQLGANTTFPSGHVIQTKVVESQEDNTLDQTYTVRWNYSITLKSSSSKVLVIHYENAYVVPTNGYGFKAYRDSSAINDAVTTFPSGTNSALAKDVGGQGGSGEAHEIYVTGTNLYVTTTSVFLDDVSSNFNAGDVVYYGHFYRMNTSGSTVQVPSAGGGGDGFFRTIIMEVQK